MSQADFIELLTFTNETLTASTVIIAASLLLYNLVRNVRDRVAQASAALLGCITVVYTVDSIVGLDPTSDSLEAWYRVQWLGLAFLPTALFHLADALLATTGRISRGRRRRIVRMLYMLSALFALLAALSDSLAADLATEPTTYLRPGPLFSLYTLYFVIAALSAIWLVWRARQRCLTTSTRRRMSFLLLVFPTPALGLYPYTPLFNLLGERQMISPLLLALVFNLANFFVIMMLIFLSYPLSFFGTNKPDRVIKTELLQFLLRGPMTAIVLLAVLVTVPRLTNILGLKREDFLIITTIAVLLSMQWGITMLLPWLEKRLIYTLNHQEARRLRRFSDSLITRADAEQLQEAILAAVCNQLRVPMAFLVAIHPEGAQLEQVTGDWPLDEPLDLSNLSLGENGLPDGVQHMGEFYLWEHFWLFPLHNRHKTENLPLLGVMGVWARENPSKLAPDEQKALNLLLHQATKVLSDLRIQRQIFAQLDEMIVEAEPLHKLKGISRYGYVQAELAQDTDNFVELVHGALRDFWGGPKLAESDLIRLEVVQKEQGQHSDNPTRALQAILTNAIDSLKPPGERSLTNTEWVMYNILDLRFLQGKKVRDAARLLLMSEQTFYRKQKLAIEEVARRVSEMERRQAADLNNGQAKTEPDLLDLPLTDESPSSHPEPQI